MKPLRETYPDFIWQNIGFGKYAGLTLPALILEDPFYFFWLCDEAKAMDYRLKQQVVMVHYRLSHIRPPKSRPDNWGFRLKSFSVGDETWLEPVVVKRSAPHAQSHLSLRSIGKLYNSASSFFFESFLDLYDFDWEDTEPGEISAWLLNDHNFSLTCTEDHSKRRL